MPLYTADLLAILGKPKSSLDKFVVELGDFPCISLESEAITSFDFLSSGLSLTFNNRAGFFDSLTFFVEMKPGDDEYSHLRLAFDGELPNGISRLDSQDVVKAKLPGACEAVKDYRFDKDLRPFVFQYFFDRHNCSLQMISVDYELS